MARARRVDGGEESSVSGIYNNTSEEVDPEVLDNAEPTGHMDSGLSDRVLYGSNLRRCSICLENDIEPEEFRKHVARNHKSRTTGTPQGYYGCRSGQDFWIPLIFATGPCKWMCSVCGRTKYYFGKGNTHGGPATRLLDRRYGLAYCTGARYGDKAGHKRAFGKIDGGAGPVIFLHEGAPNPEQPEQTDPSVLEILNEKGVQRKTKRKNGGERTTRTKRAVRVESS